jgi:hypothetical protein
MESAMRPRGGPSAPSAGTLDSMVRPTRFSATAASPAGLMAVCDFTHAYVINLANSLDRRALVTAELEKTCLDYEFVTAVDGVGSSAGHVLCTYKTSGAVTDVPVITNGDVCVASNDADRAVGWPTRAAAGTAYLAEAAVGGIVDMKGPGQAR